MSQQINLFNPALLRKRDWFALSNIVLGAGVLVALAMGTGFFVRGGLPELQARAMNGETQLKAMREQVLVLGKRVAERKTDPRIEQELASTRMVAKAHGEVLQTLRHQLSAEEPQFADYLRGLARQSMDGLWITGFTWNSGGDGLQLRGRTIDPALLPEYIRRLNREPAFRGQSFSALNVAEGKPDGDEVKDAPVADPSRKALFHEFVLIPVGIIDKTRSSGGGKR